MNFKDSVIFYLNEKKDPERVTGGYKAMATRLSRDLGKSVSASQVKSYLKKMDKEGTSSGIKKQAKKPKITDAGAYQWSVKYRILLNHFKK